MAITKLMNIKSSPHGAGRHLYNSIKYIVNPEKTEEGLLIGGNSGSEVNEIYDVMMNTKRDWDKTDGRQGYHFVLSWKPGEIDSQKAYIMMEEFCEEYLGDNYDYVFSVHNDHEHMHGHIVFNSVARSTGYKYRYQKGDWEKYIQPITDKICERHGLKKLEYDKEKKVGKSYAEYFAEKEGWYTWKKIICSDIDYFINHSSSWKEFLEQMKRIGYTFPRSGVKKNLGEYITFCAPGNHRRRSDSLGPGYSVADIKKRIAGSKNMGTDKKYGSPKIVKYKMQFLRGHSGLSIYQKRKIISCYQATTYYSRKNPYAVNQNKVRKNLMQIERLREDCRYILREKIRSEEELERRLSELKAEEKYWKSVQGNAALFEKDELYEEYLRLSNKLLKIDDPDNDEFEIIEDRLEELEAEMPVGTVEAAKNAAAAGYRLLSVRQERRIIRHIKKMDAETEMIPIKNVSLKKVGRKSLNLKKEEKLWEKK